MSERRFILRDMPSWRECLDYLMSLRDGEGRFEVRIRPWSKKRSTSQNSRYWANLTGLLDSIQTKVNAIADHTGYTAVEVRRLIASDLLPECVAILFARTPEVAHDVIKVICDVPTSTRLGTKEFMVFETRMEQVVTDIAASIDAIAMRMAA